MKSLCALFSRWEAANFLLTNRIPRRLTTRLFGWFSRIEQPRVSALSIAIWRRFSDLDLSDARDARFRSLHDCFIRRLREGARPIDPDPGVLVSPCDAIVGACGAVQDGWVWQIKGSPYRLHDLLTEAGHADLYREGCYVTLRLTAAMYHRFHAPHDCRVQQVSYIPGDTWNVNPPALKRVERLFCRNERAAIRLWLAHTAYPITLVPVAAILVAGIRLNFLPACTSLRSGGAGTTRLAVELAKGEEMGWFEHGSTIVVFAPAGFSLAEGVEVGTMIRVGQRLMRLPRQDHKGRFQDASPAG